MIGLLIFSFVYVTLKIGNNKSLIDKLITQISYDNSHLEISSFKEIMILIPAFNEGDNLKKLLPTIPKKIQDLEVGILVIDDGSEDDTGLVAKEFNAIVVKNIINRGQGSASKLGYKFLKDFKVVSIGVTMDADNQHRAEDIEALISPIIKGNSDLVIGSRMLGKRGGGRQGSIRRGGPLLCSPRPGAPRACLPGRSGCAGTGWSRSTPAWRTLGGGGRGVEKRRAAESGGR